MDHEFLDAIKAGDENAVERLLANDSSLAGKNFKPDSLHSDGLSLVHAAEQGSFQLVKLLLEHGADPNAELDSDETAAMTTIDS